MANTLSTIDSVISALPQPSTKLLPRPEYTGTLSNGVGLAVASMQHHTSDEGWEIFKGLQENGYILYGHNLPNNLTDVESILPREPSGIYFIQDLREWQLSGPKDFRDPRDRFTNYYRLGLEPSLFKVTILKDAHQRPEYHRQFMEEIGCHGVVCYYHPRIVHHLAPYTRPEHLIRTYHTINPTYLPPWNRASQRQGALLSGALGNAYPLRQHLIRNMRSLALTTHLPHPGYHRNGCQTPKYLQILNQHRIAVCTCSVYGYALRKIIEATVAGCIVVTNLPTDDVLPGIDENLVRIPNNITVHDYNRLISNLYGSYDEERQRHFTQIAISRYSYPVECKRLADTIEHMRSTYNVPTTQP